MRLKGAARQCTAGRCGALFCPVLVAMLCGRAVGCCRKSALLMHCRRPFLWFRPCAPLSALVSPCCFSCLSLLSVCLSLSRSLARSHICSARLGSSCFFFCCAVLVLLHFPLSNDFILIAPVCAVRCCAVLCAVRAVLLCSTLFCDALYSAALTCTVR